LLFNRLQNVIAEDCAILIQLSVPVFRRMTRPAKTILFLDSRFCSECFERHL
jgi:hypothetical protein